MPAECPQAADLFLSQGAWAVWMGVLCLAGPSFGAGFSDSSLSACSLLGASLMPLLDSVWGRDLGGQPLTNEFFLPSRAGIDLAVPALFFPDTQCWPLPSLPPQCLLSLGSGSVPKCPCLSPACLSMPTFLQPRDHNRGHYTFLAWQPMV